MRQWALLYLLNSAWQIPVLALSTVGLSRILRKARPLFEHRLWVTCFLLCLLIPAFSLRRISLVLDAKSSSVAYHGITSMAQQVGNSGRITIPIAELTGDEHLHGAAKLLLWFYLLSIALGISKLTLSLLRTRHLIRTSTPTNLPVDLQHQLLETAHHLQVRPVATYTSAALASPAVVGWPEPCLLLPEGFAGIPREDAMAALGHEMAHVGRRDFYLNLVYGIATILAFYHPVLHWIKGRVDASREVVCDELAAVATNRVAYARSLFRLAGASRRGPAIGFSLGIFQTTTLEDRIMRLLTTSNSLSRKQHILQTAIVFAGLTITSALTAIFTLQPAFAQALEKRVAPGEDNSSYSVVAAAHGDTAKISPSEGTYIHKWIGADGKVFVVASREKREPTDQEKHVIEEQLMKNLNAPVFSAPNADTFNLPKLPSLPRVPQAFTVSSSPFTLWTTTVPPLDSVKKP
jgi:beta-lactamase regulating signal transducer with metallopeptidase domain